MLGLCEVCVVCHPNPDPDARILLKRMICHMVVTCPMRGCQHIVPRSLGNQAINPTWPLPDSVATLHRRPCIEPHAYPIARRRGVRNGTYVQLHQYLQLDC